MTGRRLSGRCGLVLLALVCAACSSGRRPVTASLPATAAPRQELHFSNIVLIMLENHEEPDLIGSDGAPYLTQLARDHTLLSHAYAVGHTSLPNYLALISGQTFGLRRDCNTCFQDAPTLADQLEAAGHSWTAYFEDMPQTCALGDDGAYVQRHNPFVYFGAIREDAARCQAHIVPFARFDQDLAAGALPDFAWISPNLCHDLHSCDLSEGDAWLRQLVPQLLATPAFQPGGAGLLIVTTDEGTTDDGCCGDAAGGHIATILVSPLLPPATVIDTPVSHYGVLRLIEDNWGLPPLGDAARAVSGADLLGTQHAAGP
ncbi:MAG TPA: alkaline phosphatase family protein [Dehalococcoidia bacterium]|nr:alkaline phosphatase family protein [Dehalococcoidia bacterium]